MALAQYNAEPAPDIETLWFTGTETLPEGGVLCYDVAATFVTDPIVTRLGRAVTRPSANNLAHFAGIVHPSTAGRVGPCFVDVIKPRTNQPVRALVTGTMAVNTSAPTLLKPVAASFGLGIEAGAISNTTHSQICAKALEAISTGGERLVTVVFI